MKTAILVLALTLGGFAVSGCQARPPFERVHDTAKVLGFPGDVGCSGTAVGRYQILTASHCMEEKPNAITVNGEQCEVFRAEHDGSDHALLIVDCGHPFKTWAKFSKKRRFAPGDEFFYWGNPLMFTDQLRFGRITGVGRLPAPEGVKLPPPLDQLFDLWDSPNAPGDSGAGIFNMRGELVSVVSIWTDPSTRPFHLGGSLPLAFTKEQRRELGL